jgi:hypothetical protein
MTLPGVVVNTYNPARRRLRKDDRKFEASLGFLARPCLKKEIKR